jgi:hypothetical protein
VAVECTGYLEFSHEVGCYRCGGGATQLWVLVVDGDTDDEQYICDSCVREFHVAPTSLRITAPLKEGPAE